MTRFNQILALRLLLMLEINPALELILVRPLLLQHQSKIRDGF